MQYSYVLTNVSEENAKIEPGSMVGERRDLFIYCIRKTAGCTSYDIAEYIKGEFDNQYSPGWACIVARGGFGYMCSYQDYICINDYGREKLTILLFR